MKIQGMTTTGLLLSLLLFACNSNRAECDCERVRLVDDAEQEHDRVAEEREHDGEGEREHAREGERGGDGEREHPERVEAKRQLEVLRLGFHAFREAEAGDAADRIEHAIHARELGLEGRRDEEAQHVRETAPNREELALLLRRAAGLWGEWGHEDKMRECGELSRLYYSRVERSRAAGAEREREERRHEEVVEGLESLEHRVEILRLAAGTLHRAGKERHAEAMAGAVHFGELLLSDGSGEELAEAAEGVPSKGNLIELLQVASRQLREWEAGEEARACHALAEHYAAQMREEGQEGAEEPEAEERHEPEGDIESLEHRIEIVRWARGALAEAGKRERAGVMERFLHVAELQLEGADGEKITAAFEGLSQEMIIDQLHLASDLYAEWGWEGRAHACHRLAEFYLDRWSMRDDQVHEAHGEGAELHVYYQEVEQRIEQLQAELDELRALLHRLTDR